MAYAMLGIVILGLIIMVVVTTKVQVNQRERISKLRDENERKLNRILHYNSFLNRFIVGKELPGTKGVKLKGTDIDDIKFFNNQIDLAGRIAEGKEEPKKEISSIIIFKTEGFREHLDEEEIAPHVSLEKLKQDAMECINGERECLLVEGNNHEIVLNRNQIVSIEVFYKS